MLQAGLLALLTIAALPIKGLAGDPIPAEMAAGFSGVKRLFTLVDVAQQAAVQNEIGLTDKAKLYSLSSQRAKATSEALAKAGVHPTAIRRMSSEVRIAKSNEIFAKMFSATSSASAPFDIKLKGTLSAEQFKRVVEIFVQWGGVDALDHPLIADALAFSKEQRASLVAIRAELDLAFQSISDSEMRMDLAERMVGKASKLLTRDQADKLAVLRGRPFDGGRFFTEDPAWKALGELGPKNN